HPRQRLWNTGTARGQASYQFQRACSDSRAPRKEERFKKEEAYGPKTKTVSRSPHSNGPRRCRV
ncbi:hypothetical protein N9Z69_03030, partial [bacterium]|nr:hypothetical protein [bacterium]